MMVAKHNSGHLIVLAAGGTGGHVFPAEAVAQELLAQGDRLILVTDRRGATYSGALGSIETHRVAAGAVAGKGLYQRLRALIELGVGFFQARALLARLRPAAVVGFGGYASVPTLLAAINLDLPTVIHEQNAVLGRANRLLAARVKRVCLSFELARPAPQKAKLMRTGMPVRPAVAAMRPRSYVPPLPGESFRLVVFGGSQGARVFSDVIPAAVMRLPKELQRRIEIYQQCRPEDLDRVAGVYQGFGAKATLRPFFDNVPELLAAAHLVIARSGASTVAELSVVGRPAILVPYPFAVDNDQAANAAALASCGGSWIMPQAEFTVDALAARLRTLAAAPEVLADAAAAAAAFSIPDAASRLANAITAVIRGENGARHGTSTVAALGPSSMTPGAT